jgi:hypothetical protein
MIKIKVTLIAKDAKGTEEERKRIRNICDNCNLESCTGCLDCRNGRFRRF